MASILSRPQFDNTVMIFRQHPIQDIFRNVNIKFMIYFTEIYISIKQAFHSKYMTFYSSNEQQGYHNHVVTI